MGNLWGRERQRAGGCELGCSDFANGDKEDYLDREGRKGDMVDANVADMGGRAEVVGRGTCLSVEGRIGIDGAVVVHTKGEVVVVGVGGKGIAGEVRRNCCKQGRRRGTWRRGRGRGDNGDKIARGWEVAGVGDRDRRRVGKGSCWK